MWEGIRVFNICAPSASRFMRHCPEPRKLFFFADPGNELKNIQGIELFVTAERNTPFQLAPLKTTSE